MEKNKQPLEQVAAKCSSSKGDRLTSECSNRDITSGSLCDGNRSSTALDSGDQLSEGGANGENLPPNVGSVTVDEKKSGIKGKPKKERCDAIRVTNLSENTQLSDLVNLMRPFGMFRKVYLGTDKVTGKCEGYAYVHFRVLRDATEAIEQLNGRDTDYGTLHVEWFKREP